MLKMLPVKSPERLVLLSWVCQKRPAAMTVQTGYEDIDETGPQISPSFAYPSFVEFREQNHAFSSIFGFTPFSHANVNIDGQASLGRRRTHNRRLLHRIGCLADSRPRHYRRRREARKPLKMRVFTNSRAEPIIQQAVSRKYGYIRKRDGPTDDLIPFVPPSTTSRGPSRVRLLGEPRSRKQKVER